MSPARNRSSARVLGGTAFDRRKHDTAVLHERMANEVVQAFERARK